MNIDKHIWEGWTVGDFIDELEPRFDAIQRSDGFNGYKTFKTKEKLKEWIKDNQPYYKKHIPEVYKYFLSKTNL